MTESAVLFNDFCTNFISFIIQAQVRTWSSLQWASFKLSKIVRVQIRRTSEKVRDAFQSLEKKCWVIVVHCSQSIKPKCFEAATSEHTKNDVVPPEDVSRRTRFSRYSITINAFVMKNMILDTGFAFHMFLEKIHWNGSYYFGIRKRWLTNFEYFSDKQAQMALEKHFNSKRNMSSAR